MKMIKQILLWFALCGFAGVANAEIEGCVLYKHKDFKLKLLLLVSDAQFGMLAPGINNEVSSAIVGPGCELYLYREWLFEDLIRIYPEGHYPLLEANDEATSAECFCDYIQPL